MTPLSSFLAGARVADSPQSMCFQQPPRQERCADVAAAKSRRRSVTHPPLSAGLAPGSGVVSPRPLRIERHSPMLTEKYRDGSTIRRWHVETNWPRVHAHAGAPTRRCDPGSATATSAGPLRPSKRSIGSGSTVHCSGQSRDPGCRSGSGLE